MDGVYHHYAKTQAWNSDGTLLATANGASLLLDATDYTVLLTDQFPTGEKRWAALDPNTLFHLEGTGLYAYSVSADASTLIRDFAAEGCEVVRLGPWEGNLSIDDDRVALACQQGTDLRVLLYALDTDTVIGDRVFTGKWGDTFLDWISVSQSGQYVVANWRDGSGMRSYDTDLNLVAELTPSTEHGDLCIDSAGEEVYVQVLCGGDPERVDAGVMAYRLDTGARTTLLPPDDFVCSGHVSCRNTERPGWAYISSETHHEVFALKLDGSGTVEHYAQTHQLSTSPLGTPSPDGCKVAWASDWSGAVAAYVVDFELGVSCPVGLEWDGTTCQPQTTLVVRPSSPDASFECGAVLGAGTPSDPLTLPELGCALENIQQHGSSSGLTIELLGGTYVFQQPWVLGAAQGVDQSWPMTIRPHGADPVVLRGSNTLTGTWTSCEQVACCQGDAQAPGYCTNDPTIYRLDLVEDFNTLFVDGQRATRARHPNVGTYPVLPFNCQVDDAPAAMESFTFTQGLGTYWSPHDLNEMEVVVRQAFREPRLKMVEVVDVDTPCGAQRRVQFWTRPQRPFYKTNTPTTVYGEEFLGPFRFYTENSLRFVDAEGEWYLDKARGALFLKSNTDPTTSVITAPSTVFQESPLVQIGSSSAYASSITIEGLTFAHTDWRLAETNGLSGYKGAQALSPPQAEDSMSMPAALLLYCDDCLVSYNRMVNVGGDGIRYRGVGGTIEFNRIEDVGGHGVALASRHSGGTWTPSATSEARAVTVRDNHIRRVGQVVSEGVGIISFLSPDGRIEHNLLEDLPYTGISLGFDWTNRASSSVGNQIVNNEIVRPMQVLNDGGGIYTAGPQGILNTTSQARIASNWIHDLPIGDQTVDTAIHTLYFDRWATGLEVLHNVGDAAPGGEVFSTTHPGLYQGNDFSGAGIPANDIGPRGPTGPG